MNKLEKRNKESTWSGYEIRGNSKDPVGTKEISWKGFGRKFGGIVGTKESNWSELGGNLLVTISPPSFDLGRRDKSETKGCKFELKFALQNCAII